jgi:cytochrome c553
MDKNRLLPVSLLVISTLTCAAVTAEDRVAPEENKTRPSLSEFKKALELTPNIDNGRKLYKMCVTCHGPEGWGDDNGAYPQIAGQLPGVTIKQLADIRAGNRDNPIMRAFSSQRALGGAQEIADVAGYIATLPMTAFNGQGNRRYLPLGKEIYMRDCVDCHGENGEGDVKKHVPVIHGQHYRYLERQYKWIRDGRRRNANKEMVEQIQGYTLKDELAVLSYTASLMPPEDKLAEPDWQNPDFPNYTRSWRPDPIRE